MTKMINGLLSLHLQKQRFPYDRKAPAHLCLLKQADDLELSITKEFNLARSNHSKKK